MRIGSLFSGYGGLDLAVTSVLGGEVVWHVEYDKAPSMILDHHFPGVPNYGDVTAIDWATMPPVDILTGGYPCQPFSHAGKRKGTNDERHLWPYVRDALRDLGPRFALLENVRGHLTLGFDTVLADLADIGWSAEWVTVRASDAGAPHRRERLFILAHADGESNGEHAAAEEWSASLLGRAAARPCRRDDAPHTSRVGRSSWWAGSDERTRGTGQPARDSGAAADADLTGSQARGAQSGGARRESTAGQRESVGRPAATSGGGTPADPRGERHGRGQDDPGLGRLDGQDEGSPRQRERSWQVAGDRGEATLADAASVRPQGRKPERVGLAAGQRPVDEGATAARDTDISDGGEVAEVSRLLSQPGGDRRADSGRSHGIDWGEYAPAISRWERVLGRPAPLPTEPGRTGSPRLSPAFVEWMMGLPAGWVTDPVIGIGRNAQLKALGNGVVPQQGALALRILLERLP